MPSYRLLYHNIRGKAEITRLMFKLKAQEFEDVRFEREEWLKVKPDQPFGALPVLEVDGVKYCQSQAIERLIAKRLGLYGDDDMTQARADMVVGCVDDLLQAMMKQGIDEEKKEEIKKFYEETLPPMLTNFEKMVHADGFFLGKELMWPDISFAHVVSYLSYEGYDLNKYPKLAALKNNVENEPNIAAWIKERPVTHI